MQSYEHRGLYTEEYNNKYIQDLEPKKTKDTVFILNTKKFISVFFPVKTQRPGWKLECGHFHLKVMINQLIKVQ